MYASPQEYDRVFSGGIPSNVSRRRGAFVVDPRYECFQDTRYDGTARRGGTSACVDSRYGGGYQNTGYRGHEDPRYRGYEDQRYRGYEDQRYRGYEDQRYRGYEDQRYRGYEDRRYTGYDGRYDGYIDANSYDRRYIRSNGGIFVIPQGRQYGGDCGGYDSRYGGGYDSRYGGGGYDSRYGRQYGGYDSRYGRQYGGCDTGYGGGGGGNFGQQVLRGMIQSQLGYGGYGGYRGFGGYGGYGGGCGGYGGNPFYQTPGGALGSIIGQAIINGQRNRR